MNKSTSFLSYILRIICFCWSFTTVDLITEWKTGLNYLGLSFHRSDDIVLFQTLTQIIYGENQNGNLI